MYRIAQKSLEQELNTRGHVIVRRLAESHSYQVSLGLADELKPIIDKLMSEKEFGMLNLLIWMEELFKPEMDNSKHRVILHNDVLLNFTSSI